MRTKSTRRVRRSSRQSTILTALLGVALLMGAVSRLGATEARDFAKPGPYPVGVRTLVFVDDSRPDDYKGKPRTLVTEVWYPAVDSARGGRTTKFSEFFGEYQDAARLMVEHFGGKLDEVDRRFRSTGVRDARIRAGEFPLLVFSHGNGGVRHQNVFQVDHLASHGYVVVSPDHTGNASVTPLSSGALRYDRKGRGKSAKARPKDVSFLISRLLEESARTGAWLAGRIDEHRVGVLGHSFGGFTACKVAETDARVKAILPMTVAYGKRTSVPLMVMLGDQDRTMRDAGNAVARMYYQASEGPKHLLTLKRGGHFSFTDMDHISPEFGDGVGKDKRTGNEFLEIDRAKKIINSYSLAFFDAYLRGDARGADFLSRNIDANEIALQGANLVALNTTRAQEKAAPAKTGTKKPSPPRKARILIVTGDDVPAHDWRKTTPLARKTLEADPRVEVFVCEDASILESSSLSKYAAIFLNYRNPPPRDPGEKARKNLAAYVEAGGGLAVIHFGVYAFPGWNEYREIIGRVWVGRQDGKKVSGHTPRGPFDVSVVDSKHAITTGIRDFKTDDELYSKLQGNASIHVLLDADSKYSGKREPIAWTREYGKGRVFVTVLGHDIAARTVPAVEKLYRQGTAWAAGLPPLSE